MWNSRKLIESCFSESDEQAKPCGEILTVPSEARVAALSKNPNDLIVAKKAIFLRRACSIPQESSSSNVAMDQEEAIPESEDGSVSLFGP